MQTRDMETAAFGPRSKVVFHDNSCMSALSETSGAVWQWMDGGSKTCFLCVERLVCPRLSNLELFCSGREQTHIKCLDQQCMPGLSDTDSFKNTTRAATS